MLSLNYHQTPRLISGPLFSYPEPKGRQLNVQELQEEYDRFEEDASFFPEPSRGM